MKDKIIKSIKKLILLFPKAISDLGQLLLILFLIWCVLHGIQDFFGIEYHPRDE